MAEAGKKKKETPMMRQFNAIKAEHGDSILFFRLGDFYEMFGDDALLASRILNITLTARGKGEDKYPMCGVPYHAAENYIAKLTRAGKKVAICEQISDPKEKGIVERAVVRTITPGTTFDDNVLDQKQSNFLVSVYAEKDYYGLSVCDITTGDFRATEIMGDQALATELKRLRPKECILLYEQSQRQELRDLISSVEGIYLSHFENFVKPYKALTDHFQTMNLEGFGLEKMPFAIQAAGTLLSYLKDTQQSKLEYLNKVAVYRPDESMLLDESTLRNLELFSTSSDHSFKGSLLWVLDETATAMGGRLLKEWLLHPLLQAEKIEARHAAVAELKKNLVLADEIKNLLGDIYDLERIMGRLGCLGGNARDLLALRKSLEQIPVLSEKLAKATSPLLTKLRDSIVDCSGIRDLIEKSIAKEPPVSLREGNIINDGYNSELDELRAISKEGKGFISKLEAQEIERTGINSLKVKYNKVFGYYIEIRKSQLASVPDDYIRKQTLVNAERYITPELKEYEEKVLNAQEKIVSLEYEIFQTVREEIMKETAAIQTNARIIAQVDVLQGFAQIARKRNYCQPSLSEGGEIKIDEGRHPVIEAILQGEDFISNDIHFDEERKIKLITGPNMAGKSTYLRQTALIVLMAHIGSFVPATAAVISPVDRIFTRVGASDNLVRGQSTFMVEMQEAANILNNATEKSLIILDEIGRGTSTYDGVSIAWAIIEHIHNQIKAKTLFASHYHELISVADSLRHAENVSVAVKENKDGVVFLYKIVEGGVDRSYGIEVAKLAGLPHSVVAKSKEILADLEEEVEHKTIEKRAKSYKHAYNEDQLDLFSPNPNNHPALLALRNLDINRLTPLEALQKLDEIKGEVGQ